MLRKEKERLEYMFGIEFLKKFDESLVPFSRKDESPDIIISSKRVGLEITQLSNSINNGISRMQLEGSWDSLIENLRIKWKEKHMPGCHVSLTFIRSKHIPKKDINKVSDEIIEFIKGFIPKIGNCYYSKDGEYEMPSYLLSFRIERILNYKKGIFTFGDFIFSPDLEFKTIERAIKKKDKLRNEYLKKCDNIWLLLVAYGGRASGDFVIKENLINHEYLFGFDKVFLFDAIPKKYWQLKKSE